MAGNSDYTRRRAQAQQKLKNERQNMSSYYPSFSSDVSHQTTYYTPPYDYQIPAHAEQKSHTRSYRPTKGSFFVLLLISALAFAVALGSARITSLNNQIDDLNAELANVQAINQKIQIDIEQSTDLKEIENYATNELKMSRPESHQTVYINPKQPDMVEIEKTNGFVRFFKKLWSYIG